MMASDPLMWIFAVAVSCAAGLTLVAVKGTSSVGTRLGAIALMAGLVGGGYVALTELMSRPKPASLEWVHLNAREAKVAASELRENEAIYLWLIFEGESEPRAYRLPWNMEMAQQLREAQSDAERRKSDVKMDRPFQSQRMEDEKVFHAPPRAALPAKRPEAS